MASIYWQIAAQLAAVPVRTYAWGVFRFRPEAAPDRAGLFALLTQHGVSLRDLSYAQGPDAAWNSTVIWSPTAARPSTTWPFTCAACRAFTSSNCRGSASNVLGPPLA